MFLVIHIIGGLLVFGGQWVLSRQSTRLETQKWKQEELREVRRDIVQFREKRARPILEALDRATRRWDADSYYELADRVGYQGDTVDNSDEHKKELHKKEVNERREKYLGQLMDDISAATTIHDENVRTLVTQVLWQSAQPEADKDYTKRLREAYLQLENWIFNPQQSSPAH